MLIGRRTLRFGRVPCRLCQRLDFLEVRIHDAVVVGLLLVVVCASIGAGLLCASGLCSGSGLIHLLKDVAQSLLLCLDVVDGAGLDSSLELGQLCFRLGLDVSGHLVAVLFQHLLGLEDHLVGTVADIDLFTLLLIVSSKLLSFLDSLVDVFLGHVGGSSDGDVLLLAGAQVLSADLYDAVCIDIKGNFDLRHATGSRSNAIQVEDTQALVVAGKLTLALQDVDLNRGLVIRGSGEDLALVGGDGGVAVDDLGADAAQSLNAQAQRGDIQQQQALDVALQDAALDGSTDILPDSLAKQVIYITILHEA